MSSGRIQHRKKFHSKNITLESAIEDHAAWAFENIYSKPYPTEMGEDLDQKDKNQDSDQIMRKFHGIHHAARAASYVAVLANLYRLYRDEEALALTDEDLKLLQIAVLFHDAARKNEGVDYWDKESGELLFDYLHNTLGVAEEKAKLLQNAVANKDEGTVAEKNIYAKIIHDADCLDVMRVKKTFNVDYLDLYQQFKEIADAEAHIAELVIEVQNLIAMQGEGFKKGFENEIDMSRKKIYESVNAYQYILKDIQGYLDEDEQQKAYPLLDQLVNFLYPTQALEQMDLIAHTSSYSSKLYHGTNFDTLLTMGKLEGEYKHALVSFGKLLELGVPCFNGELGSGIKDNGINLTHSSWSANYTCSRDYATGEFNRSGGYGAGKYTLQQSNKYLDHMMDEYNCVFVTHKFSLFGYPQDGYSWRKAIMCVLRGRVFDEAKFNEIYLNDSSPVSLKKWLEEVKRKNVITPDLLDYHKDIINSQMTWIKKFETALLSPLPFQVKDDKERSLISTRIPIVFELLKESMDKRDYMSSYHRGEHDVAIPVKLGVHIKSIYTSREHVGLVENYLRENKLADSVKVKLLGESKPKPMVHTKAALSVELPKEIGLTASSSRAEVVSIPSGSTSPRLFAYSASSASSNAVSTPDSSLVAGDAAEQHVSKVVF